MKISRQLEKEWTQIIVNKASKDRATPSAWTLKFRSIIWKYEFRCHYEMIESFLITVKEDNVEFLENYKKRLSE